MKRLCMMTVYMQAATSGMDEATWDLGKQNSMLKQLVKDCKTELYEVYTQVGWPGKQCDWHASVLGMHL